VTELTMQGHVAVLRMNHGKANAMDVEFCDALTAQFTEIRHSTAQSLVITGSGRIFSAGVDLLRVLDGGAAYLRTFLPAVSRTFEALFSLPKPVVAAVNGHAIAGGCVMACAADYRMMAREPGRIGIPELLVGVPFPVVPLEIMRFAAPPQHLQSLVFRGATLAADAALEHGLVDAVVDPEGLVDEAVLVAERLAALPAAAFALTKQQLREPALLRIRSAGPRIDPEVQQIWESPATLAAIRDYIARTFAKA
jgi:enoyl-CoA hydratase